MFQSYPFKIPGIPINSPLFTMQLKLLAKISQIFRWNFYSVHFASVSALKISLIKIYGCWVDISEGQSSIHFCSLSLWWKCGWKLQKIDSCIVWLIVAARQRKTVKLSLFNYRLHSKLSPWLLSYVPNCKYLAVVCQQPTEEYYSPNKSNAFIPAQKANISHNDDYHKTGKEPHTRVSFKVWKIHSQSTSWTTPEKWSRFVILDQL